MAKVEVAVDVQCRTGESPVSYPNGTLLFVDIEGRTIHQYDTVAKKHVRAVPTNGMPGNVVPCESSNLKNYDLIASLDLSVVPMSFFGKGVSEGDAIVKAYEAPVPIRFNDGKVDPEGRLWCGTMALDPDTNTNAGSLYCLQRKSSGGEYDFLEKIKQVGISNGTDWIGDHMYYIDTLTHEVAVYNYNASNGSISNRTTIFKVPETEGLPDGLTVDASGKLWVAIHYGSKIVQIDPERREVLMTVPIPALCTTSLCFGGKDLSELYVTSGAEGAKKRGRTSPTEGGTFCVRIPGVKGSYFSRAFTQ